MKKLFPLLFLGVFLASCATVGSRIKKDEPYFSSLPADKQQTIKHGQIGTGYSPRMVEIAWGSPPYKKAFSSGKKTKEVWIYQYEGVDYEDEYVRPYHPFWGYRHHRHVRRITVPHHYLKLARYVLFENGKAVEFGRPNRVFEVAEYGYRRHHHHYNTRLDYCADFGIRDKDACEAVNESFLPALDRLNGW